MTELLVEWKEPGRQKSSIGAYIRYKNYRKKEIENQVIIELLCEDEENFPRTWDETERSILVTTTSNNVIDIDYETQKYRTRCEM